MSNKTPNTNPKGLEGLRELVRRFQDGTDDTNSDLDWLVFKSAVEALLVEREGAADKRVRIDTLNIALGQLEVDGYEKGVEVWKC